MSESKENPEPMAVRHPNVLKLAAPALVFFAVLAVLAVLNRSSDPPAVPAATGQEPAPVQSAAEPIDALRAAVRSDPGNTRAYAQLGEAFLQRARETGDPSHHVRAEQAFRAVLRKEPRDIDALVGLGTLALARHDFGAALRYAEDARRRGPDVVRPYTVLVDALVELGRYEEAGEALQRMLDLKPSLAAYARASYFRELHGDLPGAVEAMRLAVSAGAGTGENTAYVQTLLGNLELARGRGAAAASAYRAALERLPGYLPAEAGLARLEASRGRLGAAIRRYRTVVDRLPLPEYAIALGEAELAAGRRRAALRDLALVRAQERLLAAGGVNTDVEIAIYEADHGNASRAVRLARRAWSAAPSVRSADALGWALTAAGRPDQGFRWGRRALELGSRDAFFLFHAGMSARASGRRAAARSLLRRSLALNPRFSPYHAARARRALEALS